MAELVDAHDSKSCSFGSVGSIPTFGTKPGESQAFFVSGGKAPPPLEQSYALRAGIYRVEIIKPHIQFPEYDIQLDFSGIPSRGFQPFWYQKSL